MPGDNLLQKNGGRKKPTGALAGKRLVLVTSHRRESWGHQLQNICEAIKEPVPRHPDVVMVYPVHPNPLVKETAAAPGSERRWKNSRKPRLSPFEEFTSEALTPEQLCLKN